MATIKITVTNLENVEKVMNNLVEQISNPPEQLMRRIGETAIDDIEKRFMTRGYGTWAPLKPETIARKKGNSMVLIDTGAMFSSLKIAKLSEGSVEVDVPFGGKNHSERVPGFHQKGTSRMPSRKIIEVTPQLTMALKATVNRWVADMIKAYRKGM